VKWAWNYYNLTEIVVSEFGFSVYEEDGMPLERATYDIERVDYFVGYLNSFLKLVNEDKINISGAISWGFLDNFEWNEGLGTRFGLQYVNYTDESRYFKKSAFYFKDFFQTYLAN
jgi:beta-glucosidase